MDFTRPPVAPQTSRSSLASGVLDRSMNIVGLMKHLLRRESTNMPKNIFPVAARHESSSESQIGP